MAPVPEAERDDMINAYHRLLHSPDKDTRLAAARAWSKWEYVRSLPRHPVQKLIRR